VAITKADKVHNHDDLYYTKAEVNGKASTLISSINNAIDTAKAYSDTNLKSAKAYADKIASQIPLIQIVTWEADD
jgi:hypothetical protein